MPGVTDGYHGSETEDLPDVDNDDVPDEPNHFLGGQVPAMSASLEDLKMAIEHFEPKFNDGSLIPAEDVIHMLRHKTPSRSVAL